MPVILEFLSLIIRRDRIEDLLPGGWPQFLAEYGEPFEGWADDDLVRFGAMNQLDIDEHVAHWESRGLALMKSRNGRQVWGDMVLHSAPFDLAPMKCDWLGCSTDRTARFVGQRQPMQRPRINSPWSNELVNLSHKMLLDLLGSPPGERTFVAVKSWDDRFGMLSTDGEAAKGLIVTDRATGKVQSFRLIEDLLNAGWVVD